MRRIYLEVTLDEFGNVTGSKTVSSEKIAVKKKGIKFYAKTGADESDNVALLRQALSLVGGPVALAARLGMSRSNIYQFIYRNHIHEMHMEKIRKIISEHGLTIETDDNID